MKNRVDVAIIGAGFSGALLARVLARRGRSVALIDAATHPRFAIGESSTPIADRLLARLGKIHGFDDLVSLSRYGTWKSQHRQLGCGLKRGFSYYVHRPGQEYFDSTDHDSSLLVAASASDDSGDTHWYRSDVDQYLFQQAVSNGVRDFTGYRLLSMRPAPDQQLILSRSNHESPLLIDCEWAIDATGRSAVLANLRSVRSRVHRLQTKTYSIFAHFDQVGSWRHQLRTLGISTDEDPFDTDAAAQHHLIDDGWMWMLRFDNGITSVGRTSQSADPAWDWSAYHSLAGMFQGASVVAPTTAPVATGRLQQLHDPVIDRRTIMLPTAAVTIDPLHSTGIAHALAGVDRVAKLILAGDQATQRALTADYRQSVLDEAELLDRLVWTAYQTMNDFPRFVAACTLYFAGAIACEERLGRGELPDRLWGADDQRFLEVVEQLSGRLTSGAATDSVVDDIRTAIAPWNHVGLLDPSANNRYAYTATKR